MLNIIAQIFGLGAMISLFCIYQQNSRKKLIIRKLCADVCWVVHYLCLGGYGGMVPNFVGIFRELVFIQRDKKRWASSVAVPIVFILLNWGIGISTFQQSINILPIAASTFVTVSLWLRKPKLTKIISVPISLTFLIYDIFVGSWIGVINEIIAIVSIIISFIKERRKIEMSIFSNDCKTDKPEIIIKGVEITEPAARIDAKDASEEAKAKGAMFAQEITQRFVADFEKKGVDKMAHVSTFMVIDGIIYMTYYANTKAAAEDPENQTARFVYCPENEPENQTVLDIQSVGDICSGLRVNMVYDTILARKDEDTLYILWTAKVGDTYYRLYRPFSISQKALGEIGVNRLKVGDVINDFSASGIVTALTANGIGYKYMYSDIGIMQKFTTHEEDGKLYYYTGAYSGDLNMIIKSTDFITWEYVSQPSFPNLSKWENAIYVIGDKCYYFVRQQDFTNYGFLTVYDIAKDQWETPVLVEDCQSRSDFIVYNDQLYMFHAPIDREHIEVLKIDTDDISKSEIVLQAKMETSCYYPFIQYFDGNELAMSYTVAGKKIRLARFTLSKYL